MFTNSSDPCDVLMARKKNWFNRLKRFFGSETKSKQEKKEWRKRWFLWRLKSNCSLGLPAPLPLNASPTMAVAVDTVVVAAQASAEVVRLTGTPLSYRKRRQIAAMKIQTAFRGYLARKALRALKGLVKLQSLIRGQVVRRQTRITLEGLQSLMKMQLETCDGRARMAADTKAFEDKNIVHGKIKNSVDIRMVLHQNSERKWDSSILSKEEMNSILKRRLEAALKRERAMEYAFSSQEKRNLRRPTTPTAKETDVLNQRWSWLDHWLGAEPLDKNVPENSPVPSPEQDLHDQRLQVPDSLILVEPVHNGKDEDIQLRSLTRRSFNRSRRRDDYSFPKSPSFPRYMASTASTKARLRSMSTPKQQLRMMDACSDSCTRYTNRLLSSFPTIVSEAGVSKTGKPLLFHPNSPCLRGQAVPIKSRRFSNYLSFDAECSWLNWDQRNAFR